MKKSVLLFSLLSRTALMFPRLTIASGILPTHTSTPKPKPAFQFEQLDKAYKTAGICFLGVGDCDSGAGFSRGDDYSVDTEAQCLNAGYTRQNCNSLQTIDNPCPYNAEFGLGCRCVSNLVSCPAGQVGVGDSCNGQYQSCQCDPALVSCTSEQSGGGASCGGKYQYCNCKSEYKYTSANCPSPQILSGKVCGGQYTGCSCPSGVSENDFGCAEYYPSPCSSVCKTPKSDNCDNRTEVSTPYGCAEYWEDCSSKCKTAYNDNCRNRTEVSCEYSCASYFADCQSKCQACGSNPDCSVTGKTCENGCKTTNSCGICTECRADTKKLCNADGYTETSCPNLYEISNCPYDDSYKKCTKTCAAVLAGAKTVSTAAELKSADAYDATIMMLNDITVSGTMMFRSKDIIWPSDEVCASQYPTRPTLTIGTFTMSDESTRHLIDVNINAQTIDIPVSVAIDLQGKVTADRFIVNNAWLNLLGDLEIGTWYQNGAALGISIDGSGFNVNRPWLGQGDYDQMSTIKINNFVKNTSGIAINYWSVDNSNIYIPANMFEATAGEIGLQCKANFNVNGSTSYCGDFRFYDWGNEECGNQFTVNGKTIIQVRDCSSGNAGCSRGNYSCN